MIKWHEKFDINFLSKYDEVKLIRLSLHIPGAPNNKYFHAHLIFTSDDEVRRGSRNTTAKRVFG